MDRNNVSVKVDLTSVNLNSVTEKFQKNLEDFELTEEAKNLSEKDMLKKSLEILINALKEPNLEKITTSFDIPVRKIDKEWNATITP